MNTMHTRDEAQLIDGIANTIQRVYGDAMQTVLDRQAAEEIFNYLRSHGMAPLSVVAAIVKAAGGRVVVPDTLLLDPPAEIRVTPAPEQFARIIEIR